MRRAFPIAAALLLLAGSASARTLVVGTQNFYGNASAMKQPETLVTAILDAFGATYDALPWSMVDTTAMRTAYVRDTLLHTGVQYDAVVHCAWWKGASTSAAFDAGWVTRIAGMSKVPQVLIGAHANASVDKWANGASAALDTTWVGNTAGPTPSPSENAYRYYDAGSGRAWWTKGLMYWPRASGSQPTDFVPLVSVGAARYQQDPGSGTATYGAMNELVAPRFGSLYSDTLASWKRLPPAKHGFPRGVVFFCNPSINTDATAALVVLDALAGADSASGRKVFDNPGRVPQRMGVVLGPAFATANYRGVTIGKSGMFCAADSCDTTNQKAALDSIVARRKRVTVGVQLDSTTALAYQKAIFERLGAYVKYTPMDYAGIATGTGGNASRNRLVDVLGATRTRALIPPGATTLPCPCASSDSSIYCLVRSQFAKLDSMFTGRVDHTLCAPGGDWARSITRTNGRTLDSLLWTLYWAGVRAIETNPLDAVGVNGAGPWDQLQSSSGYLAVYDSAGAQVGPVRRTLYRMPIMADRHYESASATVFREAGHDYPGEFLWGRFVLPWYQPSGYAFYQHDFMTRLYLYREGVASLGGAGQGTTPFRPGLWRLLSMFDQVDMVNRRAGRDLIIFDWAENVAQNPGGIR